MSKKLQKKHVTDGSGATRLNTDFRNLWIGQASALPHAAKEIGA
jgi:hypothetical protein